MSDSIPDSIFVAAAVCKWCDNDVSADSFRDDACAQRYACSALCQSCQDETFLSASEEDASRRHRLYRAAVVAWAWREDGGGELAVLPFVFVSALRRVAWDPRLFVRAGVNLPPLNFMVELVAMADRWRDHRIRVREVESLVDRVLIEELARADLVVALEHGTLCALTGHCGALPGAVLVSLVDTIPWQAAYGLSPLACLDLLRLHALKLGDALLPWPPSSLGECAVVAAFLELVAPRPPFESRTGFDLVLASRPGRFEAPVSGGG